ncbi:MAG: CAAX prenyl protease-related protein [Planctomycetota bacterium]|nr:CAAX prenyl protease-related protein [Planctomycetota bacterium]MDA1214040.1 CAAX prenyl protease-related protein [Planctomycetota bacterium]
MNAGSTPDEQNATPDSQSVGPAPSATFSEGRNFAGPYVVFLLLMTFTSWSPLRPYYPWMYALTIVLVSGFCWTCHSAFPAWSWRGIGLGVVAGVAGVILWVGLCHLNLEGRINEYLPDGMRMAERVGYNPWEEVETRFGQIAFLCVRLAGMVLLVPLIEELFWRGCIWRYIQNENFTAVPWGVPSRASIIGVTILFASTHTEYITAIAWCSLINVLFITSRNLWSCVVAHAVTNLLLAAYILQSGHWELW